MSDIISPCFLRLLLCESNGVPVPRCANLVPLMFYYLISLYFLIVFLSIFTLYLFWLFFHSLLFSCFMYFSVLLLDLVFSAPLALCGPLVVQRPSSWRALCTMYSSAFVCSRYFLLLFTLFFLFSLQDFFSCVYSCLIFVLFFSRCLFLHYCTLRGVMQ